MSECDYIKVTAIEPPMLRRDRIAEALLTVIVNHMAHPNHCGTYLQVSKAMNVEMSAMAAKTAYEYADALIAEGNKLPKL